MSTALEKIGSLHAPLPLEPLISSFTRAKKEAIHNLTRELNDLHGVTLDQFADSLERDDTHDHDYFVSRMEAKRDREDGRAYFPERY